MSQPPVFEGEWDEEGVFVYQAFNDEIADWALEHQALGGPAFNPRRMTWIKPSFAWMLYRSGYGQKHHQTRILKLKLSHASMAELLRRCSCREGGGGSWGRVQWDPARDLFRAEGKEPALLPQKRAIQIGLKGPLSEEYVKSIISIQEVTELAHQVGIGHQVLQRRGDKLIKKKRRTLDSDLFTQAEFLATLPEERPYLPHCSTEELVRLGMKSGATADWVQGLGRGGDKMDKI